MSRISQGQGPFKSIKQLPYQGLISSFLCNGKISTLHFPFFVDPPYPPPPPPPPPYPRSRTLTRKRRAESGERGGIPEVRGRGYTGRKKLKALLTLLLICGIVKFHYGSCTQIEIMYWTLSLQYTEQSTGTFSGIYSFSCTLYMFIVYAYMSYTVSLI